MILLTVGKGGSVGHSENALGYQTVAIAYRKWSHDVKSDGLGIKSLQATLSIGEFSLLDEMNKPTGVLHLLELCHSSAICKVTFSRAI